MLLPGLLAGYGQEIEADLQRVYGVDLVDLYRGLITPRRVWVLISQLPPGSNLARAVGGNGYWSHEEVAIHEEGWALRSAIAGKKLPPPEPPEVGWRDKQREQQERFARKLEAHKRRTESPPPPT